MVPPSLSFTLTASCCRVERYFQATSAILRLPRGQSGREDGGSGGRRRGRGEAGNSSLKTEPLSISKATVLGKQNYSYQHEHRDGGRS